MVLGFLYRWTYYLGFQMHCWSKYKRDLPFLFTLRYHLSVKYCGFVRVNTRPWADLNPLHWRHNDHDGVSNHQPHGCLLNRLLRRRSKKTPKLRDTGLCAGNSPWPVNSPLKGQLRGKCFRLMTSSCNDDPAHWHIYVSSNPGLSRLKLVTEALVA